MLGGAAQHLREKAQGKGKAPISGDEIR